MRDVWVRRIAAITAVSYTAKREFESHRTHFTLEEWTDEAV